MSTFETEGRDREVADVRALVGFSCEHGSVEPPADRFEMFRLSEAATNGLTEFAGGIDASVEILMLAALKTLLHRITGQDEIAVCGFTSLGGWSQPRRFAEPLLSGVIVRTRPSGALPFRDYLVRVRDAVRESIDAGEVASPQHGDEFRTGCRLQGDAFARALVSVALSRNASSRDVTAQSAAVDLHLDLEELAGGLLGRLHYDDAQFDAATVRRIVGQLVTLLERVAVDPDCPLASVPLLTEEEARRIRLDWNDTARDVPDITLTGMFEAQRERTPELPALRFGDGALSYRELDRRADDLAARLAAAGAGPGKLVALCLERSPDLVAALLGILKTGAAYLPLDPAFPTARLAMIAEDARPAVLLTQQSLQAMLPDTDARIVFCDVDAPQHAAFDAGSIDDDPEAVAYVLYTSGSTGRPKGVEVPHRAVVNLLASMRADPGFGTGDSLLAVTTIAFDIATLELFLPLVSGGCVILASREAATDPLQLLDLVRSSCCTMMQATPATWRGLIAAGWQGDPGLRILCGGEVMSRDLADQLLARCGALWNLYGPTETTVWSTMQKIEHDGRNSVPIGRPIFNTTTTILDAVGGIVPVGIPGELHIGGRGVALGYRRNEALTRERFIADPRDPDQRLYRTGDIARYRADGAIEWLARADGQVKIRGYRIETQEIEAALERHPGISAAAVRTWPDDSGQPCLAAYVVPAIDDAPDGKEMRQFLRRTLPDYMIPARYTRLAAMPLTPNGKLDRNALPKPAAPASAQAAATGDRERRLAAIWERLLDVAGLGSEADFFELGGDSIRAVSLLLDIEAEFGRRLTLATLFQAPTIARLASLLGEADDASAPPLAAGIQPNGTRPSLFWIDGGPMFLPLANALGTERPFLGVTLHPPELREVGFQPDLQTIARHLVRTITTIQSVGPYVIGGYCAGGVLAYEVASQLMASGQGVDLLCMIDAQNPTHFKRVGSVAAEFAKFRHHLAGAWRASGTGRLNYVALHVKSAYRRILSRSAWRPVMKSEPFTLGEIMQPAVAAYRPGQYAGRVALFQARRPKPLDLRPGWAETVTGQLIGYEFAGTHQTMLEQPQVRHLARLMNACLDENEEARCQRGPEPVEAAA